MTCSRSPGPSTFRPYYFLPEFYQRNVITLRFHMCVIVFSVPCHRVAHGALRVKRFMSSFYIYPETQQTVGESSTLNTDNGLFFYCDEAYSAYYFLFCCLLWLRLHSCRPDIVHSLRGQQTTRVGCTNSCETRRSSLQKTYSCMTTL